MNKLRQGGFTLFEVLIALVIFSVMGIGLLRYSIQGAQQMQELTDKTLAAIIAQNEISGMRSGQWPPSDQGLRSPDAAALQASLWPATGDYKHTISMAQSQWNIAINVQNTESADVRRVEIGVARQKLSDTPGHTLLTLVGFIGRH